MIAHRKPKFKIQSSDDCAYGLVRKFREEVACRVKKMRGQIRAFVLRAVSERNLGGEISGREISGTGSSVCSARGL